MKKMHISGLLLMAICTASIARAGAARSLPKPCADLLNNKEGRNTDKTKGKRAVASAEPTKTEIDAGEEAIKNFINNASTSKDDLRILSEYLLHASKTADSSKNISYGRVVVYLKSVLSFVSENKMALKIYFDPCRLMTKYHSDADPVNYQSPSGSSASLLEQPTK